MAVVGAAEGCGPADGAVGHACGPVAAVGLGLVVVLALAVDVLSAGAASGPGVEVVVLAVAGQPWAAGEGAGDVAVLHEPGEPRRQGVGGARQGPRVDLGGADVRQGSGQRQAGPARPPRLGLVVSRVGRPGLAFITWWRFEGVLGRPVGRGLSPQLIIERRRRRLRPVIRSIARSIARSMALRSVLLFADVWSTVGSVALRSVALGSVVGSTVGPVIWSTALGSVARFVSPVADLDRHPGLVLLAAPH